MDFKTFLKYTPGLAIASAFSVMLAMSPPEELLTLNKIILVFLIPITILLNYIAVNIRRVFTGKPADIDFLFLVTHMSSIATGRPPRSKLFELYSVTNQEYGVYSRVLKEISMLSKRWGYSYVQAIRYYIKRIKQQSFRDFLARFAEAMNMGEDEVLVLESERNIAMADYEARYQRSLDLLRILLGIYTATVSSAIFVNVNMFIISMIMGGSGLFVIAALLVTVTVMSLMVYMIYRFTPRDKTLHDMKIQPAERKTIAYGVLTAILVGSFMWAAIGMLTKDINIAFIVLALPLVFPGVLAYRYESNVKRKEMFFQAFVRSYGLTYSVVRNHITALRSLLRVDLGPLTNHVKRLYARLSNGIDKKIAWMYFAAEVGSENIRRCIDIVYDTIDSGGDISKTGIVLSELLLRLSNLRQMRRQVVRAFIGVVYVLHVIMIVVLEFIVALMTTFYNVLQAVGGTGVLPFPMGGVDIQILLIMRVVLIMALSVINAMAIKTAEGGFIQTFWLYLSTFLVLSTAVSLIASSLARFLYEMVNIEELMQLAP